MPETFARLTRYERWTRANPEPSFCWRSPSDEVENTSTTTGM